MPMNFPRVLLFYRLGTLIRNYHEKNSLRIIDVATPADPRAEKKQFANFGW